MKTSLRTAALAAAWMGMACAYAEPQVVSGSENSERVQIVAPGSYKLAPTEFNDYAYTYVLDNGQTIRFSQRARTFYAQLHGEVKTQMFGTAPGVFMTAAGARVEFRDDGEIVAIRNFERLPMTAQLPENTLMMAGR